MPNTKITKQKLKDHWSYSKRIYIVGALCALLLGNLLFSMTRYQAPNEYAVHIALVDSYVAPDKLDDIVPKLLAAGQEFDSTLELVSFGSIAYSGNADSASENDYYGAQVYMVQLYAGDNDIYIQNARLTNDLISQGYCYPLETLESFETFVARYPDVKILWGEEVDPTVSRGYGDEEEDEDETEPKIVGPQHAYAIDVSTLTGMAQRGAYNHVDKYACLVLGSANPETSFEVFLNMFDLLSSAEAK